MKYFSINEMSESQTAKAHKINNTPTPEIQKNLEHLINNLLDPLRAAYGKSIHVTSGYRCQALNTLVKGAKSSQHTKGEAADITGGSAIENKKLFLLAQKLDLPFDQLIDEYNFKWIHISLKFTSNRNEILHIK